MRTLKIHDDHGILFEFTKDDFGTYYVSSEGKALASFALMDTADGWRSFDIKVIEAPFESRASSFIASFCADVNAGRVPID
jgi:hypothetical protein